jgi:pilus assembly protein Flp/PilA
MDHQRGFSIMIVWKKLQSCHPAEGARAALLKDQKAASAIEYGLIAALVVVAAVAGMAGVGTATGSMWNKVSESWCDKRSSGPGKGPPRCR